MEMTREWQTVLQLDEQTLGVARAKNLLKA